jgi:hypothetical protein
MEIRQTLRTVPSRPIVLVLSILAVLALAVTAWSVLGAGAGFSTGSGQSVTTTGLGPDAQERNSQLQHEMEDATHGH